MSRRDPFGNRIDEIMEWDATNEATDYTIEDGLSAAAMWDLPEAYTCIVRSVGKNGKVLEKAYRSHSAAHKHLLKLRDEEADEVMVLTDETISVPLF
tara:strand:- start:440 stop:730 length:291 start_codon:yes stop_codon:yes gene_type:complete